MKTTRGSTTYETEEYGGFLLMMDTVPDKSGYDYGANYLRVFLDVHSPDHLADQAALRPRAVDRRLDRRLGNGAGRRIHRPGDRHPRARPSSTAARSGRSSCWPASPSLLRTAYEYFRLHADVPWVQFWWAITYYNAWFMVVTDDPLVWFYYNWGFSTFPIVVFLWFATKFAAPIPLHDPGSLPAGIAPPGTLRDGYCVSNGLESEIEYVRMSHGSRKDEPMTENGLSSGHLDLAVRSAVLAQRKDRPLSRNLRFPGRQRPCDGDGREPSIRPVRGCFGHGSTIS